MKNKWHKPPISKFEVRKREEKYKHLRKSKDYKNNAQCLNRFDKSYRKLLDTSVPYQFYTAVKKYMAPYKIYKGITFLVNKGYFNIDYIGNRRIIPTEEIMEELLRREMCAFKDWTIWNNDKSKENYKKLKHERKLKRNKSRKRKENRELRKMLKNNK